jgi:hypothetical protein
MLGTSLSLLQSLLDGSCFLLGSQLLRLFRGGSRLLLCGGSSFLLLFSLLLVLLFLLLGCFALRCSCWLLLRWLALCCLGGLLLLRNVSEQCFQLFQLLLLLLLLGQLLLLLCSLHFLLLLGLLSL